MPKFTVSEKKACIFSRPPSTFTYLHHPKKSRYGPEYKLEMGEKFRICLNHPDKGYSKPVFESYFA